MLSSLQHLRHHFQNIPHCVLSVRENPGYVTGGGKSLRRFLIFLGDDVVSRARVFEILR